MDRWNNYVNLRRNGTSVSQQRYNHFQIPATATQPLQMKYRKKLLLEILELDVGEVCLEIGCGIPHLSLDMAALSEATVIMLDLRKLSAKYWLLLLYMYYC